MTQQPRIPDAETRKREVRQLREAGRQLDEFILSLLASYQQLPAISG